MTFRDCLLPASIWPRLQTLDTATDIVLAMYLWAQADRDGISPVDRMLPHELVGSVTSLAEPDPEVNFRAAEAALCLGGFAVIYRGLDGVPWAWVPDVAVYAPPQPLRRSVEDSWPAPSPADVSAVLSIRLGRPATDAECRQACPRAYGRKRAASPPMGDDIDRVYRAWREGQTDKDGNALDLPEAPSPIQRRMIATALKECPGNTPREAGDAMILILQYVYGADDKPARYLRGQSAEGRKYLGLDNLTVASKIRSRLAFAQAWVANRPAPPVGGSDPTLDGIDLGPLARFRT